LLACEHAGVGGAAGKLVCGYLGAWLGVLRTVILTEGLTAAALNGTSSVLYGTVPELVAPEQRTHAFGIFYTGTAGAAAVAPVPFGAC
jgi:MFS transporter, FSR family, fosmidomycin resistance protein